MESYGFWCCLMKTFAQNGKNFAFCFVLQFVVRIVSFCFDGIYAISELLDGALSAGLTRILIAERSLILISFLSNSPMCFCGVKMDFNTRGFLRLHHRPE